MLSYFKDFAEIIQSYYHHYISIYPLQSLISAKNVSVKTKWLNQVASKKRALGSNLWKKLLVCPQVTWKHPVPQHWPLWTNHTKSAIVPTKFLQPQTSKPQRNSVNQVNLSVTEPNLGLYWVRYILSPQGSTFFSHRNQSEWKTPWDLVSMICVCLGM